MNILVSFSIILISVFSLGQILDQFALSKKWKMFLFTIISLKTVDVQGLHTLFAINLPSMRLNVDIISTLEGGPNLSQNPLYFRENDVINNTSSTSEQFWEKVLLAWSNHFNPQSLSHTLLCVKHNNFLHVIMFRV